MPSKKPEQTKTPETEEEYKEWVKQSFKEEHNIELEDNEISDIEFEGVNDEKI